MISQFIRTTIIFLIDMRENYDHLLKLSKFIFLLRSLLCHVLRDLGRVFVVRFFFIHIIGFILYKKNTVWKKIIFIKRN